jgi:hypothetical protein
MALNDIELCSSALIKLGAEPISAFDDGTAEARVAAHLYPIVRDALLSAHPWSFATKKAELVLLMAAPASDFSYAHELPADFLKALSAGDDVKSRGLVFQIIGREVHSDADEVVLSYVFQASESDFPAYFTAALVTRLAAEFCLPLTENASRADHFAGLAEAELKLARLVDSQQDSPPKVEDFTLIRARLG